MTFQCFDRQIRNLIFDPAQGRLGYSRLVANVRKTKALCCTGCLQCNNNLVDGGASNAGLDTSREFLVHLRANTVVLSCLFGRKISTAILAFSYYFPIVILCTVMFAMSGDCHRLGTQKLCFQMRLAIF